MNSNRFELFDYDVITALPLRAVFLLSLFEQSS
jgi:hypothetical protein